MPPRSCRARGSEDEAYDSQGDSFGWVNDGTIDPRLLLSLPEPLANCAEGTSSTTSAFDFPDSRYSTCYSHFGLETDAETNVETIQGTTAFTTTCEEASYQPVTGQNLDFGSDGCALDALIVEFNHNTQPEQFGAPLEL